MKFIPRTLLLMLLFANWGYAQTGVIPPALPDSAVAVQKTQKHDSVKIPKKEYALDLQLDRRNSFLPAGTPGSPITVNGLNAGLNINHVYRLGIGGYIISDANPKPYLARDINYKRVLVQKQLKLYYFTPNFTYSFFTSKWLDLSIPFEFGGGWSNVNQVDTFGVAIPLYSFKWNKTLRKYVATEIDAKNVFMLGEIGFCATIKVSDDVGLSAAAGFRQIFQQTGLEENFNGVYWSLGLKLIPGHLKNRVVHDYSAWKAERKQLKLDKANGLYKKPVKPKPTEEEESPMY